MRVLACFFKGAYHEFGIAPQKQVFRSRDEDEGFDVIDVRGFLDV